MYESMAIESKTFRTYDESRIWFRYNEEEILKKRDGISLRASGISGLKLWLFSLFLSKGKADWHNQSNMNRYLDTYKNIRHTNRAVAFFQTRSNSLKDWIGCGRDYARFHLALTQQGLVIQPLSQILQEFPEMKDLYNTLHKKLNINKPGRIQMAVRIGKANPAFITPRRSIDDLLTKAI